MNTPPTEVADQTVAELTPEQVAMQPFLPDDLPQRTRDLEAEVARARELANGVEVTNPEQAAEAVELTKRLARERKAIEAESVERRKPRRDASEEIKSRYDALKEPIEEAEAIVRKVLEGYQAERDRIAKEKQRLEEAERARVEAEARAKREAAEKAEREAAELAAEAKSKEDAEAAAELAEEARRDAEKAGVTEQAIASTPPSKPAAAPKLAGFSIPKPWTPIVTDPTLVPDTLPDGTPLKVIDMVAARKYMHAYLDANGGQPPVVPGFEFKQIARGSSVTT